MEVPIELSDDCYCNLSVPISNEQTLQLIRNMTYRLVFSVVKNRMLTVAFLKFLRLEVHWDKKTHFLMPNGIFMYQEISDQCLSYNCSPFKYFLEQFKWYC